MMKSRKRSVKKSGSKRKLNAYFQKMLQAKRTKASSFIYKGKKYVGRSHKRLGMIYKKA
jgi:hypothetical protein